MKIEYKQTTIDNYTSVWVVFIASYRDLLNGWKQDDFNSFQHLKDNSSKKHWFDRS